MYDIQSIYQAVSVDDAIRALATDPSAVVIAGGTDVLIKIREGKLAGCRLVSIHELTGELAEESELLSLLGEGVVGHGDVAEEDPEGAEQHLAGPQVEAGVRVLAVHQRRGVERMLGRPFSARAARPASVRW